MHLSLYLILVALACGSKLVRKEEVQRISKDYEGVYVVKERIDVGNFDSLNKVWRRIRIAAGIPDARLPDLRHTYASFGAAGGVGLPLIGGILGHRQASTTQRYAHLADTPLRAAAHLQTRGLP